MALEGDEKSDDIFEFLEAELEAFDKIYLELSGWYIQVFVCNDISVYIPERNTSKMAVYSMTKVKETGARPKTVHKPTVIKEKPATLPKPKLSPKL